MKVHEDAFYFTTVQKKSKPTRSQKTAHTCANTKCCTTHTCKGCNLKSPGSAIPHINISKRLILKRSKKYRKGGATYFWGALLGRSYSGPRTLHSVVFLGGGHLLHSIKGRAPCMVKARCIAIPL